MPRPHRVQTGINHGTDALANIQWPKEWQYEIRPAGDTPFAKGLPEVAIMFFQSQFGRHIDATQNTHGRINQHPAGVRDCISRFPLQQTVDRDKYVVDVGKHVTHALARRFRHHCTVARGDRFEDRIVCGIIEAEHGAVEALERIARRAAGSAAAGNCCEHQRQYDRFNF